MNAHHPAIPMVSVEQFERETERELAGALGWKFSTLGMKTETSLRAHGFSAQPTAGAILSGLISAGAGGKTTVRIRKRYPPRQAEVSPANMCSSAVAR